MRPITTHPEPAMSAASPLAAPALPPATRRHDLDWVRILAFGLLILYHVGMYYVDWDWHVKSPHATSALMPWMMLTSPWRLGLLFFVSGCAASFYVRRRAAAARANPGVVPGAARSLLRERTQRLLIPLAVGIWFIVPPQSWREVVEKVAYTGSYLDFWRLYAHAYDGFCRGTDCLRIPTWNHLWFVAYLWVYAMLLALAVWLAPGLLRRVRAVVATVCQGVGAIVVPAALLALLRLTLSARFPQTHALVDDWYNHAQYLLLFALGVALADAPAFWETLRRARWPLLAGAIAAWAGIILYFMHYDGTPELLRTVMRGVYGLDQWLAPAAALGFARQWNPGESKARRYLTEAVFPFYIVHQTAIILIAVALRPLALGPFAEAPLLIAGTVATCGVTFEIVRRVGWLRPLFGLMPRALRPADAASSGSGLPTRAAGKEGAIIAG
jgi:hypothetical protein